MLTTDRPPLMNSSEVTEAISEALVQIVTSVKAVLEDTPPELAADVADKGMILTGGGALLRNLDKLLSVETGVPAYVADDPLTCVARGTGVVLQELDRMDRVLVADTYARPPR